MALSDTCVFCGCTGEDFDPEHWVPKWFSRATIAKGKGIEHHVPGRDPWIATLVDLTVPHVCNCCNNGWMSDLETKVRDHALPLIQGAEALLRRNELALLARWCFMKAITLELGRPAYEKPTYPPEMCSGFRRFKQPPNGCVIWVGFRDIPEDPPLWIWFRSQGQKHALPPLHDLGGYRGAVTFKHLVIDVVGVFAAATIHVQDSDTRLVQIWPFQANLHWPPAARFAGIVDDDLV